jgi:chorismate synthase
MNRSKLRPGHAHFTYLEKYGVFDWRGVGRASARETACRVAAGAVAKKLLRHFGIEITAYLKEMGSMKCSSPDVQMGELHTAILQSSIFCPDPSAEKAMVGLLEETKKEGDSLGGIVEVQTSALPVGLGDPVYEKLEANLAKAMLSLPASKGFEIGEGFAAADMRGSMHNDHFVREGESVTIATNHAGGTLEDFYSQPLVFRVAFK